MTDPEKIRTHSFYPFIRYFSKSEKFNGNEENLDSRPIKTKKRQIMYASHIDNFIYKHYGEKLNRYYNEWVKRHAIDKNVIAYRSKKGEKGQSNIDHAADVINQIYGMESCYIMIGDFEKYFDNLDHHKLKERLCSVLGYRKNNLLKDWYKVFQSVTQYSYYNQKRVHKYCGTDKELRQAKQYKYFSSPKAFRAFKFVYPATQNMKGYGIPQGTAISAILSNVYAIDFDEQVNGLVREYGGVYRRYSDDFIVILPAGEKMINEQFEKIRDNIFSLIQKNGMKIEESKTKLYYCRGHCMTDYYDSTPTRMDYLGFVYDGKTVEMRGKSPYKFYRKAKKIIGMANKVQKKKGLKKLPYRRRIYSLYSDLGMTRRPFGNFITYAKKSQRRFDKISPNTNNQMMRQVNNRRKKLNNMLGYRITH